MNHYTKSKVGLLIFYYDERRYISNFRMYVLYEYFNEFKKDEQAFNKFIVGKKHNIKIL